MIHTEEMTNKVSNNSNEIPINNQNDDELPFNHRCGILKWRPNFLQRFRSIYLFLATMCIVCILQTALSAGYLSSQITTLERRFSIDSYNVGIIQSCFDVGFIICAIFVSFLGTRGRKPLWLSTGMFIICVGAFIFAIPEFLVPIKIGNSDEKSTSYSCQLRNGTTLGGSDSVCNTDKNSGVIVKVFFIIGQALIGAGTSPVLSLGPTYIDDHVTPTLAAPLIALLYASSALGPVLGYIIGAILLKYPVRPNVLPPSAEPGDTQWIGAWWLGYHMLGAVCFIVAAVLLFFPIKLRSLKTSKRLSKLDKDIVNELVLKEPNSSTVVESDKQPNRTVLEISKSIEDSSDETGVDYGKNLKDLPKAVLGLIRNKIFVVVTIAVCCEMFLINGFAAFLPKYIETEYKVSNVVASLIAGGLIVPSGALGICVGGLIMHRFKLKRKQAIIFSICGVIGVIVCMVLFFLIGCPSIPFAGINMPIEYNGDNLTTVDNACNADKCGTCDNTVFLPVCDPDTGVTYFSGCHAGCTNVTSNKDKISIYDKVIHYYKNCLCTVPLNFSNNKPRSLNDGECPLKCNQIIVFVCFLVVALFLTGITQNPILMVTMRSVKKHERSFALGFQFVIMRLVGYIPSPIVYGYVIDAACVHWKIYKCPISNTTIRGDCLVTDPKKLTNNLIGLSIGVKICACIVYVILFCILPKSQKGHNLNMQNNNAVKCTNNVSNINNSNDKNHALNNNNITNYEDSSKPNHDSNAVLKSLLSNHEVNTRDAKIGVNEIEYD